MEYKEACPALEQSVCSNLKQRGLETSKGNSWSSKRSSVKSVLERVECWQSFLDQAMTSSMHQLRNAARGSGSGQLSGDTFLMSQMSEQTFMELDGENERESPEFTQVQEQSQGRRRKNTPRDLVDEAHLCTLVAAYNVYFEKYSEGRTQVTQLIPANVWKSTYAEYKQAYPASVFKQDSLKERLCEYLKELKTDTSNEQHMEKAALQSSQVMNALRATEGHAKRNVLRKRQAIMQDTLQSDVNSEGTGESDPVYLIPSPRNSPVGNSHLPNRPVKAKKKTPQLKENLPMTKAQMLFRQSASIENLCKTYEKSCSKREALVEMKMNENSERQKKLRIANLKTTCDLGVIDEVEFKVCVKDLIQM